MSQNKIYANKIAAFLNKESRHFTRPDLVKYIKAHGIKMVNYRYAAGDGRLKTLNFIINDEKYLDRILSAGERVDGSSLFGSIDAGSSDLYVMPRYRTAFVNPFSQVPAMDIMCSFYTPDGKPFSGAPAEILRRAEAEFTKVSGFEFHAMGELEYYVISPKNPLYPTPTQKGYHESYPFSKWEGLRTEAMLAIAEAGGRIKYGHSEVGFIRTEDSEMSQQEIEFLPVPASEAADQLAIAKWMLSGIGLKYGVVISFAPKISIGHAGSGLHVHTCLLKNGRNVMLDKGELSVPARRLIAGFLELAGPMTAFGNTVPTSYFRLVPHQEAPINVCWAYRNRSALVRIPLGWLNAGDMVTDANPGSAAPEVQSNQTVEFRSADGSANLHFLMAGLCVAARRGFERKDAPAFAGKYFVDKNIYHKEHSVLLDKLPKLPASCWASSEALEKARGSFEARGVFTPQVIDGVVKRLRAYDDRHLSERLYGKEEEIKKLVEEYLYC
ncbi:MAG: glutamine synthetase [Elusimicrobia bacterium RIFOXYA2_FULL_58_8]|nr:MAG: glutamine synthetase [Elusimicrobia bacterium RIFOXYA12_FULL_57_11]OGS14254.1 MAG: glutamine synthetase [Elusimicrobia bacterium RIFOXYA2_FULL_58_8]